MKGYALFKGIYKQNIENALKILKIFLGNTGSISVKFGTKHPWAYGTQVFIVLFFVYNKDIQFSVKR